MPFTFVPQEIPEVVLVQPHRIGDDRGFFSETFKSSDFAANGLPDHFVQDNQSRSRRGVLRGLHFQRDPHAQGKLVSCVAGEVFDVAVDFRVGSPTFGRWVGAILSSDNGNALWVPAGFGHGFCVLSESADLAYKVTAEYHGASEGGVRWDDPAIGIEWPVVDPQLSARDLTLPLLADSDHGFRY